MTLASEIVPTAIDRRGITTEARWLSIREIAADLGVSKSTAYKWSARELVVPAVHPSAQRGYPCRRDWYEAWLGDLEQ